jgi:hypothetical protein
VRFVILGVDFDNTIVRYDALFHRAARDRELIPASVPVSKGAVRAYLRQADREACWTELQGYVYGPRMREAQPFPGVIEFFLRCRDRGIPVFIISHRTRYPYIGQQYDLHAAARDWLETYGFHDPERIGLARDRVFFDLTKEEKLRRIAEQQCTHFIDDLPEIFDAPAFPAGVRKILFDPQGANADYSGAQRVESWQAMDGVLLDEPPAGACTTPNPDHVAALLGDAGLGGPFELSEIAGGGNNRVYRLICGGKALLLKAYFRHPDDPRNRLAAEFAFSKCAWSQGIRCLPQPLACDYEHDLGLYEFVAGRLLLPAEIGLAEVEQALDFYRRLNLHKESPLASGLPEGSEACFSLTSHLECVSRRLARLEHLDGRTPIDGEARRLVHQQLSPAWRRIRDRVAAEATARGLSLDTAIAPGDRCLSPSDFGFHNAILASDGRLRFIDFEYAGWDDPAKLVCDFFCQPALPVPFAFWPGFSQAVAADLSQPELQLWRFALLLPVYRMKWCCIMLNDFLPAGARRRSFARQGDELARKQSQLEKTRSALEYWLRSDNGLR